MWQALVWFADYLLIYTYQKTILPAVGNSLQIRRLKSGDWKWPLVQEQITHRNVLHISTPNFFCGFLYIKFQNIPQISHKTLQLYSLVPTHWDSTFKRTRGHTLFVSLDGALRPLFACCQVEPDFYHNFFKNPFLWQILLWFFTSGWMAWIFRFHLGIDTK